MSKAYSILALVWLSTLTSSAQTVAPGQAELELSLERAVQLASGSQQSTAMRRGEQVVNIAKSGYGLARANLLPTLDGSVSEQSQTVNLRALGFRFEPSPTFTFPTSV